ncbi:MAG: hydroxyacid dehydrogenase [Rhodospirillales bacterium]|jgi:D-3-phosphoglycerate dehydrogenase|nr:hydroxyacid dehydrogenase [Rhodospirillales bacterium]
MTENHKRLVFFESWMDPAAERLLGERSDIELSGLSFSRPAEENWPELERAHGYHVLPNGELREPFFADRRLIARCPHLLAITSTGAGYDMIDVDACTEAGILVSNQTGANKEAVAQHVLGMMLGLTKRIIQADRALRRDRAWDRMDYTGQELIGKTVGIIGVGNIGTQVSRLCGGLFGMSVVGYDPYLTAQEFAERGAEPVQLEALLRDADFVSVNCPLTAETRGMIGADAFASMKPSAYFITTARGGIHDEVALVSALDQELISGAGVDVWLTEPPPLDHPLLAFDNVLATPHIAGITQEARYNMAIGAAWQWVAIFQGERPLRLVNPQAWPRFADRFEGLFGPVAAP